MRTSQNTDRIVTLKVYTLDLNLSAIARKVTNKLIIVKNNVKMCVAMAYDDVIDGITTIKESVVNTITNIKDKAINKWDNTMYNLIIRKGDVVVSEAEAEQPIVSESEQVIVSEQPISSIKKIINTLLIGAYNQKPTIIAEVEQPIVAEVEQPTMSTQEIEVVATNNITWDQYQNMVAGYDVAEAKAEEEATAKAIEEMRIAFNEEAEQAIVVKKKRVKKAVPTLAEIRAKGYQPTVEENINDMTKLDFLNHVTGKVDLDETKHEYEQYKSNVEGTTLDKGWKHYLKFINDTDTLFYDEAAYSKYQSLETNDLPF